MCEDEPRIVLLAIKILARLLVVHGGAYSKKFAEKNGGYILIEHHLNRWWNIPALWPICFSILFGVDHAFLELTMPLDLSGLTKLFLAEGNDVKIVFPDMLPVIMKMLKSGMRSIVVPAQKDEQSKDLPQAEASQCESPQMDSLSLFGMSEWPSRQL